MYLNPDSYVVMKNSPMLHENVIFTWSILWKVGVSIFVP
jgi:hypothetical protein